MADLGRDAAITALQAAFQLRGAPAIGVETTILPVARLDIDAFPTYLRFEVQADVGAVAAQFSYFALQFDSDAPSGSRCLVTDLMRFDAEGRCPSTIVANSNAILTPFNRNQLPITNRTDKAIQIDGYAAIQAPLWRQGTTVNNLMGGIVNSTIFCPPNVWTPLDVVFGPPFVWAIRANSVNVALTVAVRGKIFL